MSLLMETIIYIPIDINYIIFVIKNATLTWYVERILHTLSAWTETSRIRDRLRWSCYEWDIIYYV